MFNRSWSVFSVLATIAVLPLVAYPSSSPHSTASIDAVAVSISAKPVTLNVHVATVVRPLDLATLTDADFGDLEARN